MWTLRIWQKEKLHYVYGDMLSFSSFDKAWDEQCRLMSQGVMCDIVINR